MSATFDPYYKWLGIPPADQPANYYRLLGVNLFEANSDVIESAADQRMVHLRSFQTGQHASASQKLLNEVSAAKLCLLRPEKKAQYDAKLRAKLAENDSAAAATETLARAIPLETDDEQGESGAEGLDFDPAPIGMGSRGRAGSRASAKSGAGADWQSAATQFTASNLRRKSAPVRRKSSPSMLLLVGGPAIGVVAVVGVLFALNNGNNDEIPTNQSNGQQVATLTPATLEKKRDENHTPLANGNNQGTTKAKGETSKRTAKPAPAHVNSNPAQPEKTGSNAVSFERSEFERSGIERSGIECSGIDGIRIDGR